MQLLTFYLSSSRFGYRRISTGCPLHLMQARCIDSARDHKHYYEHYHYHWYYYYNYYSDCY